MKKYMLFLLMIPVLMLGCNVASPFDIFKNKSANTTAKQNTKSSNEEILSMRLYLTNMNDFNKEVFELDKDGNTLKKCDGKSCPLPEQMTQQQINNLEQVNDSDKPAPFTLPNGKVITIPPHYKALAIVYYENKANTTTLSEIVSELSKAKEAYGQYLIYGALGIIVIFALIGYYSRSYGLIGLGLILGSGIASMAYYTWVGLVVIGISLLMMIAYGIFEIKNKYIKSKEVEELTKKNNQLDRENKILRGFMNSEEMKLLEIQLKK